MKSTCMTKHTAFKVSGYQERMKLDWAEGAVLNTLAALEHYLEFVWSTEKGREFCEQFVSK